MQTYVINLDRTPARWASFRSVNSHLTFATRFSAADGLCNFDTLSASLLTERVIVPDLGYSPGALGCAASHVELWRQCAAGDELFFILEDDALVRLDIRALLPELLTAAESKGLVLLGWNFDCPLQLELLPGIAPAQLTIAAESFSRRPGKFQALTGDVRLYPLQWAFGTPGYLLSPMGAARLLRTLLPLTRFTMQTSLGQAVNKGIDVALCTAYRPMGAMVCLPPLVATLNDKATSTVQAA